MVFLVKWVVTWVYTVVLFLWGYVIYSNIWNLDKLLEKQKCFPRTRKILLQKPMSMFRARAGSPPLDLLLFNLSSTLFTFTNCHLPWKVFLTVLGAMVDSRAGRKIKDEPEAPDKERKCLKKKKKMSWGNTNIKRTQEPKLEQFKQ